jgi:hypothetical protein
VIWKGVQQFKREKRFARRSRANNKLMMEPARER